MMDRQTLIIKLRPIKESEKIPNTWGGKRKTNIRSIVSLLTSKNLRNMALRGDPDQTTNRNINHQGTEVKNSTDLIQKNNLNKKDDSLNKFKEECIEHGLEYKSYTDAGLSNGPAKPQDKQRTQNIVKPLTNTDKPLFTRNKHERTSIHKLAIGTYNVRSLGGVGDLYLLCKEAEKYNIDFIGIQEHSMRSENIITCIRGNNLSYEFYFSSADARGNGGVGILVNKKHVNYIRNIKSISDRTLRMSINYDPRLIIVSTYSPTEGAKVELMNKYYEDLEYMDVGQNKRDFVAILGDFNARLGGNGPNEQGNIYTIGTTTSRNGKYLKNFCENLNVYPVSCKFLNTVRRKYTWKNPKTKGKSEKDHILINKEYIKSVTNCRAYNTLKIDSDHRIKVMKINIKLKKLHINKSNTVRYAYEKLKNTKTAKQHAIETKNRYDALIGFETDQPTTQTKYNILQASIKHANETVLGKNKNSVNEYISDKTKALINQKDELRKKYLVNKNDENKKRWLEMKPTVKKSLIEDKKRMINGILSGIEKDKTNNDITKMYRKINLISGNFRNKIVIDTNNDEDQTETFRKYFDKLLNNENINEAHNENANENEPNNRIEQIKQIKRSKHNIPLLINTDNITADEIRDAIKSFSNNKATGCDDIKAEILKNMDDYMINVIKDICNDVYNNNKPPEQWGMNTIVPVYKKDDRSNVNNYRGISLMSIVAKTYNKVLLNRIYNPINEILGENQAGFRKHRSTVEQVHVIERIIEDGIINEKPYFIIFVDFQKAFDSIDRKIMWEILRNMGVPDKMIKAISCLYAETKSKVLVNGQLSNELKTKTGIIQGDTLSPFLFVIVMDYIFKLIAPKSKGTGYKFTETLKITELLFADDVALIGSSCLDVIKYFIELKNKAAMVGLKINCSKTKYLTNIDCTRRVKQRKINVLNELGIEKVDNFKYLGCEIADPKKEMATRKIKMWVNFWKLNRMWRSSFIEQKTKIRVVNTLILPIFLYGSETWTITEKQKEEINIIGRNYIARR